MEDVATGRTGPLSRLSVRRVEGRHLAMGLALPYLAARQPFAAFQAGELTRTVAGQILRGHYLKAFEADRLVGYLGWACYSPQDAAAYAGSLRAPPDDRADAQGVVWLMIVSARTASPAATARIPSPPRTAPTPSTAARRTTPPRAARAPATTSQAAQAPIRSPAAWMRI